ncbi:MAG: histidine phosphatase family protein [Bacteroidota bacterium]
MNISRFVVLWVCGLALLAGCKEETLVISPEEMLILGQGESIQLQTNVEASFRLINDRGGSISAEGLFTAGDSSGVFTVEATSTRNANNQASMLIRVSNRADIIKDVLDGGHVIYMRHAIARVGKDLFDDGPDGWHLSCNTDTARQLSPEGIVQAQELGEVWRELGLPLEDTLYTSEFCRCIQTVEYLAYDQPMKTVPAVTFWVYNEFGRHDDTKAFIDQFPVTDKNHLVVSHSFGPGSDYPQVEQGYTAIFTGGQSGPTFLTIVRDDEWLALKAPE